MKFTKYCVATTYTVRSWEVKIQSVYRIPRKCTRAADGQPYQLQICWVY